MDWRKLRTANGPATRIPATVRKLAAKPADVESAYGLLYDAFVRPGKWFTANAPTAQALLEVLPKATRKDLVLVLLADVLTSGHTAAWAHEVEIPPELYQIVSRRSDELYALLADNDETTRAAATVILAFLPDAKSALLDQWTKEESKIVRASLVLALARMRQSVAGEDGATALARLRLDPELDFAEVLDGLADWLRARERLPWFHGTSPHLIYDPPPIPWPTTAPLGELARGRLLELVEALTTLASRLGPGEATRRIGDLLLDLGDFPPRGTEVMLAGKLTPVQRRIVETMATTALCPVADRGLPACGEVRRRWIGLSAHGPLEEEIDGEPSWHFWRRHRLPTGPRVPLALEPLDRLQALVEFQSTSWGVSTYLNAQQLDEELAAASSLSGLEPVLARIADDLTQRMEAARREHRVVEWRNDVSSLLFLPLVRRGRKLERRWYPLLFVGATPSSLEVLASLPLADREALLLDRLDLQEQNQWLYGYHLEAAIAVFHLVPTRPLWERIRAGLAQKGTSRGRRSRQG